MPKWLNAALDYIPRWLEFQLRYHEQPGCAIAVGYKGKVFEWASGDAGRGRPLTPRHRFRAASHSKSFAAAAVMKLREQGKLRLKIRWAAMSRGCIRRSPGQRLRSSCRTAQAWCATGPTAGSSSGAGPS